MLKFRFQELIRIGRLAQHVNLPLEMSNHGTDVPFNVGQFRSIARP
jgi:hypothetical protein